MNILFVDIIFPFILHSNQLSFVASLRQVRVKLARAAPTLAQVLRPFVSLYHRDDAVLVDAMKECVKCTDKPALFEPDAPNGRTHEEMLVRTLSFSNSFCLLFRPFIVFGLSLCQIILISSLRILHLC